MLAIALMFVATGHKKNVTTALAAFFLNIVQRYGSFLFSFGK
jgi:hypothetical protein